MTTIPEITFSSFHVKNLVVAIWPGLNIDGLLGMNVLGRTNIQQADGVMYISNQYEQWTGRRFHCTGGVA